MKILEILKKKHDIAYKVDFSPFNLRVFSSRYMLSRVISSVSEEVKLSLFDTFNNVCVEELRNIHRSTDRIAP